MRGRHAAHQAGVRSARQLALFEAITSNLLRRNRDQRGHRTPHSQGPPDQGRVLQGSDANSCVVSLGPGRR